MHKVCYGFWFAAILTLAFLSSGCGTGASAVRAGSRAGPAIAALATPKPTCSPVLAEAPAAQEFKPFSFVLAADPQIGFGSGGSSGDEKRFIQLARQVNEMAPAFVLVAGDLTNWGTAGEWQCFDEAMKEFHVPVCLLMGNHDFQGRPQHDLDFYRSRYGSDYYSFTYNNCEFVCINASVLMREGSGEVYAREAETQWRWLERTLASAAAAQGRAHTFLIMHQPPFLHDENEKRGLLHSDWPTAERKRLLDMARKYGVHDILCGHLHRNMEVHSADMNIYVTGGTSLVWGSQAYGCRLFTVGSNGLEQHFVALSAPAKAHELAAGHAQTDAKSVTK